jgi:hypothetical protein
MKLRIKGNSLRLRVSRSELKRFLEENRIEDTIHFTPEAKLTYALESDAGAVAASLRYTGQEVTVILSGAQVRTWNQESEIGVYTTIDIAPERALELVVEKDFACVDRSDDDNRDTFQNPHAATVC